MNVVPPWQLRARFARTLSGQYGREVPGYTPLVDMAAQVNADVLRRDGATAQRLGSIERVTAERHAALRVGTPAELRQVGQIFAALGMHPVGFYDPRDTYGPGDTAGRPSPVVSTAFRPLDPGELARNAFRVFTSVLVPGDRRFFTAELQQRIETSLARRRLFPPELLGLAERAESDQGLPPESARRFIELATAAFRPSHEPVDRAWYAALEQVSDVAADIAGAGSAHLGHLTPRVLDLDELHRRMAGRDGVAPADEIQGPPHWDGPDILLRRTSFGRRCAAEARGIALTPAGRARYDAMTAETDRLLAIDPVLSRQEAAAKVWAMCLPATEAGLARQDLAYFTYHATDPAARRNDGLWPPAGLIGLLHGGWITAEPIVHEDFLPRPDPAGQGAASPAPDGTSLDADWLAGVLERPVHDPAEHYARQRRDSLDEAARALGIAPIAPPTAPAEVG